MNIPAKKKKWAALSCQGTMGIGRLARGHSRHLLSQNFWTSNPPVTRPNPLIWAVSCLSQVGLHNFYLHLILSDASFPFAHDDFVICTPPLLRLTLGFITISSLSHSCRQYLLWLPQLYRADRAFCSLAQHLWAICSSRCIVHHLRSEGERE